MRWLALILALTTAAAADDLTGGVLIAHAVPECAYTESPPEGWCAACYHEGVAIDQTTSQNPTLSVTETTHRDFVVLAAWVESKSFCAIEFGLGAYDPSLLLIEETAVCNEGSLVDATSGWPGPDEGISISVARENAWTGALVPVLYLHGYVYAASYGSTSVALIEHPETGFRGTASCDSPPQVYAAHDAGTLGINQAGRAVHPTGDSVPDPPETWGEIKAVYQ